MDCCCSFSGTNAKMPDTYAVKFLVNDSFANLLVPNRGEARGDLMCLAVVLSALLRYSADIMGREQSL